MLRGWNASLETMVGRFVHLETHDGSRREGKLTAVEYQEMKINGSSKEWPRALELNGDPADKIDWNWILTLTVDP
jgi:hypothetical protein